MDARSMENVPRQLLAAIACGLAGSLAGLGAVHLVGGPVVGELALSSLDVGQVLLGLFVASLVLGGLGALVGAAATAAALVATGTPHPGRATAACLVLTACWAQVVFALGVGIGSSALLMGLVPAVVRLLDGLSRPARSAPAGLPG